MTPVSAGVFKQFQFVEPTANGYIQYWKLTH